jgi:hypothetical protein
MEASQARPQNMIDTTDALEAVSACQSMKNFLFTLILIGVALCQTVFWMNHFGLINKGGCTACPGTVQQSGFPKACPSVAGACPQIPCSKSEPQADANPARLMPMAVALAVTTEPVQQAEPVAAEVQKVEAIEQAIDEIVESANQTQLEEDILLEKETDVMPAEILTEAASPEILQPQAPDEKADETVTVDPLSLFRISCRFAAGLVAVCNFIIIVSVILYCLSLLMCLKISLAGRLGGINHITRAFFISLFLLVVITPWQVVLPKVLIGSIWLPGELLCGGWTKADSSIFWKVMLYLRFCGLPFAAFWLLMWTQIRSGKWTRATLRRLGVVR